MAELTAKQKKARALMLSRKARASVSEMDPVGAEISNAPGQAPRSMIEVQNNALAQELLKKQQKRIKGY